MRFLLFTIILSSCISIVQIPLIDPPEIILPPGPKNISFVSRFDTSMVSFGNEQIDNIYSESYKSFLAGLKEGFDSIERLTLTMPDTIIGGRWERSTSPQFPDDQQIASLVSKYQPDYLLTLDAFHMDGGREQELIDYGDGSTAQVSYYFIDGAAALALYDANGKIVDKMLMDDNRYIDGNLGSFGKTPNISEYGDITTFLGNDLGYGYALMFDDYKVLEERYMYNSKDYKSIINLIDQNQWDQASIQLLKLIKNDQVKNSKQAAHNMGVIQEALGNPEEALQWYQKAQSYYLQPSN